MGAVPDDPHKTLPCGCTVATQRDFLGRMVGTILTKGPQCSRQEHTEGHVTVMPGRENARPD